MYRLFLSLLASLLFISCNEKEIPAQMDVEIQFEHIINGQALVLNDKAFTLPSGESFTAKKFKYYISNVELVNSKTGATYTEENSYHLIDQENKKSFKLEGIPSSDYDQIRFGIGVDQTANSKTDQVGDLDPNSDMVWNWVSGYKFVVLEGEWTHSTATDRRGLVLHIGRESNYKTQTLDIAGKVKAGKSAVITLKTDIDQLFVNPNPITVHSLANTSIMGGPNADLVGQNYADGFISVK